MDCPTCEAMVDAYVDGELTASESAAFERALEACPDCRRRLEAARTMSGLLRELPAEPAPDLLRARIERELRTIAGASRARLPGAGLRWGAMAASLIVAVSIGWLGGSLVGQGGRETDELVAGYIRVAMSEHGVDVASSDRHTVKPWFAGRIDYAPPVHDLTRRRLPAGRRPDRPRRRPQGGRPGLSPQPAPHRADAVAFIGVRQRQPRRSGSATASPWPTGVMPASRCAPWPISRRAR